MPSLLERLALAWGTAHMQAERALEATSAALGGALSEALDDAEQARLGVRLYGRSPHARSAGLFAWEEAFFARVLPPPPARILVGAAGAGRETTELLARGYEVLAYEPAPELVRRLEAVAPQARPFRATHESFADHAARHGRFDAVVVGWLSLSHVLDEAERLRVLRALAETCPEGPILASFWMLPEAELPALTLRGRAARLGAALGKGLGRLRGARVTPDPQRVFRVRTGFGHTFIAPELEALASALARDLLWGPPNSGYPHCAFLPGSNEE